MVEKFYDDIPKILGIVSALSFALSIVYNSSYLIFIDPRILTLMSVSDHIACGIAFLFPVIIILILYSVMVFFFVRQSPKPGDKRLLIPYILMGLIWVFLLFLWGCFYQEFYFLPVNVANFIMAIIVVIIFVAYKFDLRKINLIYTVGVFFIFSAFAFSFAGGISHAMKVTSSDKDQEKLTSGGKERKIQVVQLLANGIVFIEGKNLIYKNQNQEIILKEIKE